MIHFGSADVDHASVIACCWSCIIVRLRKSSSRRRGKPRASSDPTYESRIQAAIQGIAKGLYKSIADAAMDQNVSYCEFVKDKPVAVPARMTTVLLHCLAFPTISCSTTPPGPHCNIPSPRMCNPTTIRNLQTNHIISTFI